MEKLAKEVYPEVSLLEQVKGVGTQIALTYVLTIEDPHRCPKSREVGCFLGLRPGRRNSCAIARKRWGKWPREWRSGQPSSTAEIR